MLYAKRKEIYMGQYLRNRALKTDIFEAIGQIFDSTNVKVPVQKNQHPQNIKILYTKRKEIL